MKKTSIIIPQMVLLAMILGCSDFLKPAAEWTKSRKIAGKEQNLSHISGLVIDDKFAYVMIGGTVADDREGMSGLRKVSLETGAVTNLDDGQNFIQTERGGLAIDEKFVYWKGGAKILRVSKEGGNSGTVASEKVGVGIDLAVDDEKVYWTNHGYYSPGSGASPSPIYMASKQGGKTEIFADGQMIPRNLVTDEKFVYWLTTGSIMKQLKTGGTPQIVYQTADEENVDELGQDADSLYFGFRGQGKSRWGLRKVSKSGGEPQTLVKIYSLKPVVVDELNVYFFDEESLFKDAFCKISKNGGEVERLDFGYSNGVIANSKTLVYFAGGDDVRSFPK